MIFKHIYFYVRPKNQRSHVWEPGTIKLWTVLLEKRLQRLTDYQNCCEYICFDFINWSVDKLWQLWTKLTEINTYTTNPDDRKRPITSHLYSAAEQHTTAPQMQTQPFYINRITQQVYEFWKTVRHDACVSASPAVLLCMTCSPCYPTLTWPRRPHIPP